MQTSNKKLQLVYFSSDESMNSDDSFNSSEEELFNQRNNYKNSVYYLKEQMNHFFTQNPDLKDQIQLETHNYDNDKQQQQINQENIKQIRSQSLKIRQNEKEKNDFVQKMWENISKNILNVASKASDCQKNNQSSSKENKKVILEPSLETISNRLNMFRAKVEQVNYTEMLANELEDAKIQKKEQKIQHEINKQQEEKEKLAQKEDELVFFSFRKKMQNQFSQNNTNNQKNKEEKSKKLKEKKDQMQISDCQKSQQEIKKVEYIFERLFDDQKLQDSNMDPKLPEYQSQTGQIFYQLLQENIHDKQKLREMAAQKIKSTYKTLQKQLNQTRQFPPQIPRFQDDENKYLNIFLPDFNNVQNQNQDSLKNIDNLKTELGSTEAEFIKMMDKIFEGKIINYWKEQQNNV